MVPNLLNCRLNIIDTAHFPVCIATIASSTACVREPINSAALRAMCSAETSNSFTSSHGAPESPKRSCTPM